MRNAKKNDYKIVNRRETTIGRFVVVQDEIAINGKTFLYSYTKEKDCVIILPIHKKRIVIIKEYRHIFDECMWSFPTGSIEEGESPETAARRELKEESGCEASTLEYLGCYPVSPGTSSALVHLFVANCERIEKQSLDDTEQILVKEVCADEIEQMISNQEFRVLAGVVLWEMYKKKTDKRWLGDHEQC